MLGMLKISFGGYSIARRRRFPRERQVSFHDLPRIASAPHRATVSVGLVSRITANVAITAPVCSLRIWALPCTIHS
jgi:hypothetical protein